MKLASELKQLIELIKRIAKRGGVNVHAICHVNDVKIAARFCPMFRYSTENEDIQDIYTAVLEVRKLGERKFHPGVGAWLTDSEWPS